MVDVGFDDGDGVGADVLIADNRRSSVRASQSQPVSEPSIEEGRGVVGGEGGGARSEMWNQTEELGTEHMSKLELTTES